MTENVRVLEAFEGTYQGLNLSVDESPVGWGEAKVIIDSGQVVLRGATGTRTNEESRDLGRAKELTHEEVALQTPEGWQPVDFRMFSVGSLLLVFDLKAQGEGRPTLVVHGSNAVIGTLYSPDQVKEGLFGAAYTSLEEDHDMPGGFPRLSLGGIAPIDVDKYQQN